jgi:magnesium chelatase subunit I
MNDRPSSRATRSPAHDGRDIRILPYTAIVGQTELKLALEIAYVEPRVGGVLISGQRGTGKSTAVRAFARMMYDGDLPVTLPINATEDRVVGGWQIDALLKGDPVEQPGLLVEADGKILYIDEVNLLDDHIVNIILDVASTGILVVQREGQRKQLPVAFTLVGTMNPEEGFLRPQLLDRFGLMVNVTAAPADRSKILQTVLRFDEHLATSDLRGAAEQVSADSGRLDGVDGDCCRALHAACDRVRGVRVPEEAIDACVKLATEFGAEGHRGDYVLALAARACAALERVDVVSPEHLRRVAPFALRHRRPEVQQVGRDVWSPEDDARVSELVPDQWPTPTTG